MLFNCRLHVLRRKAGYSIRENLLRSDRDVVCKAGQGISVAYWSGGAGMRGEQGVSSVELSVLWGVKQAEQAINAGQASILRASFTTKRGFILPILLLKWSTKSSIAVVMQGNSWVIYLTDSYAMVIVIIAMSKKICSPPACAG